MLAAPFVAVASIKPRVYQYNWLQHDTTTVSQIFLKLISEMSFNLCVGVCFLERTGCILWRVLTRPRPQRWKAAQAFTESIVQTVQPSNTMFNGTCTSFAELCHLALKILYVHSTNLISKVLHFQTQQDSQSAFLPTDLSMIASGNARQTAEHHSASLHQNWRFHHNTKSKCRGQPH